VRFDLRTPGREREWAAAATRPAVADASGADGYIAALGGAANLRSIDACTTRLRLELVDRERVDKDRLRTLGASGTVNIGAHGMQVVVGPIADQVAGEIRARIASGGTPAARLPGSDWIAALGGAANVAAVESRPGRVLVTVKDAARVDAKRLEALGARGVASPTATSVHVLHADAAALGAELAALAG